MLTIKKLQYISPAWNLALICREAGIPYSTITGKIKHTRGLDEHEIVALTPVLEKYGFDESKLMLPSTEY